MLGFRPSKSRQNGDTLIEVLFAITVFSMIVVISLSIMNQGIAAAQRSLEITSVRQQMDGQVESLRFLHDAYVQGYQRGQVFNLADGVSTPAEEYYRIIQFASTGARTSASSFGGTAPCVVPSNPGKDFIINPVTAKLVNTTTTPGIFAKAKTSSQLVFGSGNQLASTEGMWLEAVRSSASGAGVGYIDFHVRACWDAPGLDTPMNLGTIVRLYEPR